MSAAQLFAGTLAATMTSRARTVPFDVSTSHGSPSVTPVIRVISNIRPPRAAMRSASGSRKSRGWNCACRATRSAPAVGNGNGTSLHELHGHAGALGGSELLAQESHVARALGVEVRRHALEAAGDARARGRPLDPVDRLVVRPRHQARALTSEVVLDDVVARVDELGHVRRRVAGLT